MTWIKLSGKFLSPDLDKAFITIGKIILALTAISSVLGGSIDIFQGLIAFYQGKINLILFIILVLLGAFRAALGYGYYLLLDMNKSGRLISLAKFLAEIGAGLSIVISPIIMLIGLIMLLKDPQSGVLLILLGGIMLCMGLGLMFFLEERDNFQIAKQAGSV